MDSKEIENVVRLANDAYEATQKAKQSYGAYVAAASALYSKQAAQIAKEVYEDSMHSDNFTESFTNQLNKDFKTHVSIEPSKPVFSQAAAPSVRDSLRDSHESSHIESQGSEINKDDSTTKVRDLFTVEFTEEEGIKGKNDGWQSHHTER